MMNAFSLRVEVSQAMSGANKFLRMGSTLYVSPELFEAMCGAKTSEELMALLARVGVVEIPEMRLKAADYVLPHDNEVRVADVQRYPAGNVRRPRDAVGDAAAVPRTPDGRGGSGGRGDG